MLSLVKKNLLSSMWHTASKTVSNNFLIFKPKLCSVSFKNVNKSAYYTKQENDANYPIVMAAINKFKDH